MTSPTRSSFQEVALVLITIAFIFASAHKAQAEEMNSSNYQLQIEPVEIQQASDSAAPIAPEPTPPSILPKNVAELNKQGYSILSGKDDQYSSQNFKLVISETNISFENLPTQNTQKKNLDLTVSSEGTYGYQIIASQPKVLMTLTGLNIKNTTCDSPLHSCSVNLANIWEGSTSYGFGYTIKGDDIPKDFKNEKYFRPFSENKDISIMYSPMTEKTRTSTMTMQLKTQSGTPDGSYSTIITIIAIPKM